MINCYWKECPIKTLDNVIDVLRMADREGSDEDNPQGAKYIRISDTLLNQITATLVNIKNIYRI